MPAIPNHDVPKLVSHLENKLLFAPRWQISRDATACLLGLNGLRIHEATSLKTHDLKHNSIRIRTLKGGKNRTLPLSEILKKSLAESIDRAKFMDTDFIFHTRSGKPLDDRNLRRRWTKWCAELFGKHFRFHDLRHTCALWTWEQSKHDIFIVADVLGHRKTRNTAIYLRDQEKLANMLPAAASNTGAQHTGNTLPPVELNPDQISHHTPNVPENPPNRRRRRRKRRRRTRRKSNHRPGAPKSPQQIQPGK